MTNKSVGTLGYMAPELLCKKYYNAHKADVWSIAVLIFSLCTGLRPYSEPKKRRETITEDGLYDDSLWKDEWLDAIIKKKWKQIWLSHIKVKRRINTLSDNFFDLMQQMFIYDENLRPTLTEIIKHEWFKDIIATKKDIINLL